MSSTEATEQCSKYRGSYNRGTVFWTAANRVDGKDTPFVWRQQADSDLCECEKRSVMGYSNWCTGEPSGGKEECVHICAGCEYRWNDIGCNFKSCAVCEIDL